uniref:uncharacterized protein LOC122593946 n=1 Tax=Erigeron canadensis TaxID=72917 RepID=UPI001CB9089B|nr:uncharacterized protein LOC122593946 [Erigeron canadensis]
MDDTRKFSLKDKIKQYLCFSCCFTTNNRHESLHFESSSSSNKYNNNNNNNPPMFLISTSSQWIKSRASVDIPEIKNKCRNMLGRIGNQNHRRRRSSADFSYDPLSYALNFEEDYVEDDKNHGKDFSKRLPPSPPQSSSTAPLYRDSAV